MSSKTKNKHIHEDLLTLRDELMDLAFNENGTVKDTSLAVIVWKLNSCLYRGYPRKTNNEQTI